jgi:HTH-type transcriptional regulator/antitoxin HigA
MTIRPIHNSSDYAQSLERLTALLQSNPALNSEAASEIEVLTTLIEEYEDKYFPIAPPSLIEAVRFRMDQQGEKI